MVGWWLLRGGLNVDDTKVVNSTVQFGLSIYGDRVISFL